MAMVDDDDDNNDAAVDDDDADDDNDVFVCVYFQGRSEAVFACHGLHRHGLCSTVDAISASAR